MSNERNTSDRESTRFSKRRLRAVDLMRIVFSIGIVLIHVTGFKLSRIAPGPSYYGAIALHNAVSPSWGIFFLLSGFVLTYRYKDTLPIRKFFTSRVLSILLPYVFWNAFYDYVWPVNKPKNLLLEDFIRRLLLGDRRLPLYYLETLMLLYLIFPLLYRTFGCIKRHAVVVLSSSFVLHVFLYSIFFILI